MVSTRFQLERRTYSKNYSIKTLTKFYIQIGIKNSENILNNFKYNFNFFQKIWEKFFFKFKIILKILKKVY